MAEDLYQTLDINRDASKDDIQKAYRKLARKYHPDLNQDDDKAQEKFKRVQEAYDVLSDEEKRAAYNRYGADFERIRTGGYQPSASGGGPQFDGLDLEQVFGGRGGGQGFENGFSDFFEQILGGAGGPRGGRPGPRPGARRQAATPTAGRNTRHEVSIPLQKAITGGSTEFHIRGVGGPQNLSVNIPVGIESGTKMRLRGKGEPSLTGGPTGDLILVVNVSEHRFFKRQGRNLELTLPVTLKEAALGAKIDVPTPTSTISLSVPPGTSSGRKLRIKGQGIPDPKGEPGDLIVTLQITLPSSLDDVAKEAIEQIDAANPITPREELHW